MRLGFWFSVFEKMQKGDIINVIVYIKIMLFPHFMYKLKSDITIARKRKSKETS